MASDITISALTAVGGVGQIALSATPLAPSGMSCLPYMSAVKIEFWSSTSGSFGSASKIGVSEVGILVQGGLPAQTARYYWARAIDPGGNLGEIYPTGSGITAATISVTPADGSIGTNQLANGAVTNEKIGLDAILSQNVADLAINQEKLAENAVTLGKIADQAITSTNIKDGSISTPKLQSNSVTTLIVAAGAIVTDSLAGGAVTAEKMTVNVLSAITANLGTINAGTINGLGINGSVITGGTFRTSISYPRIEITEAGNKLTV